MWLCHVFAGGVKNIATFMQGEFCPGKLRISERHAWESNLFKKQVDGLAEDEIVSGTEGLIRLKNQRKGNHQMSNQGTESCDQTAGGWNYQNSGCGAISGELYHVTSQEAG